MGKLTNLNPSVALTDADIPAPIARDAEFAAADAAHVSALDPHSQYLTQTEGDGRYRRSAVALTDSDIPAGIARDTETAAAITAHTSASDPHTQYLTQSEFLTSDFFFQISAPNLVANTWQDVGPVLVLGETGKPTVWLITLYFQYPDGNSLVDHWQYCGAGVLGCVWWKAASPSEGCVIYVEAHTEFAYTIKARGGIGQARKLQLNPDRNINIAAPGFIRVYFKKLL